MEQCSHPEELFNFLLNIKVKLTEENILFCLRSFVQLANQVSERDLKRPEFENFLN
jgi:hypothetical protein